MKCLILQIYARQKRQTLVCVLNIIMCTCTLLMQGTELIEKYIDMTHPSTLYSVNVGGLLSQRAKTGMFQD